MSPSKPQHTWLIRINPSYWTIFRSFGIILECELSIGLEFKFDCSMQIHCFKKTFNLIWIIFEKILNRRRQLWEKPDQCAREGIREMPTWKKDETRAQSANSSKSYRKPSAFNCLLRIIFCVSRSPATWTRKARHGTKIDEHWQGPIKRARINNRNQWNGWWHKYTKQAHVLFYNIKRNRRLGLNPRSPCAGVATGNTRNQCSFYQSVLRSVL